MFPADGAPDTEPLTAGFGDETPAAGNRYLQLGERVLVTSAFARDNFDLSAWDLRDKRVFRLDTPAARRLRVSAGETAVEVAREDGVWNILRPYRFAADPYEASQFASRLLDAEMAGAAPEPDDGEEDPFGLASPRLTAELDLVAGPQEAAVSRTVHFGGESRTPPGVFARLGADPLVFVVGKPLFDALREAAETEMANLRSLDLFRFAAFRTVALQFTTPDGETTFQRREGEEGREWTMVSGGAAPLVVDTVAVEDLLYELNSTEAQERRRSEPSPRRRRLDHRGHRRSRSGRRNQADRAGNGPLGDLRERRRAGAPGRRRPDVGDLGRDVGSDHRTAGGGAGARVRTLSRAGRLNGPGQQLEESRIVGCVFQGGTQHLGRLRASSGTEQQFGKAQRRCGMGRIGLK